ncbi:zinc-binding alcohol dehydrogenase family protein [Paraburkholderia sp. J12]|uniref:quinone oxidoreductase family protein n=1 Tax=Paraburkholderia sp. J12 TaxID=2805432 RepID=UPI002ABDAF33|nr:zinc-binding alcohol dehydrogenase family protein [Paraburkholderia sp. J12]
MKAIRIFRHGDLNEVIYDDFPMPEVGEHDVLVRVLATTVSRWDIKFRIGEMKGTALPGRKMFPLPMQPGRDAAGVVEAVGAGVRAFKPGDAVVGLVHPANPLSPMTLRGLSNLSTDVDYPGHTSFGGNAQFVARPQSCWLPLPEGVSPQLAAAAMWSYATSHRILNDRLQARAGDCVLVVGGSGGMGSATLDLARLMGVRTVAVTRSPAKTAFLKERGAAHVFIVPGEQAAAQIRAVGDTLGLDGAVDYSGDPDMLRLGVDVLRPGGTLVPVAGEGVRSPMPITASDCVRLELNIRGARASTLHDQRTVLRLLAQGAIHPAIHAVMPLSEGRAAQALLERGDVAGRIVLDPWA